MSAELHERALLARTSIGFWVYLMTDCILFASLFATYVVLRDATAGGPSGADIFEMPMILVSTIILLVSSLTSGIALLALKARKARQVLIALALTFVLGVAFLGIELAEFTKLISEGHSWQQSAFLSAFFVLVGTHGLHILVGLIWATTLMVLLARKGITARSERQLTLFGLFWHFLDLVWIFVFTVVYLMGVAQ